jgi:endophilin-A
MQAVSFKLRLPLYFQRTDITFELVDELQLKTKEYLQPNPTARAKMAAVKGISKLSGQAKASTYPQPEGVLGECMATYGRKLGEDSVFGMKTVYYYYFPTILFLVSSWF